MSAQRRVFVLALLSVVIAICRTKAGYAAGTTPSGDEILARAGAANGLSSYAVPVHFDVRMHRPISIKAGADGIVSYKAPAHAQLTITKIPGIIGKLFKSSYTIDLAPQVWPSKYLVQSVTQEQAGDVSVYVLQSVPKADPTIDHVIFRVTQTGYEPVSAAWFYKDGSSIQLAMVNQRTSSYMLPHTETIAVSMPQYSLDATATYGDYQINTQP